MMISAKLHRSNSKKTSPWKETWWKPLAPPLPIGLIMPFIPLIFIVPSVEKPLAKHKEFGLIGDRLLWRKIIAVNGKNFISVNAVRAGGDGAAIAPPRT